ncbi:MAG TPA: adenylate cyclase [Clostridiales bacterium]|nr:MAG: hypothetical protein A2Y22_02630 [Clostridiales bacterium GWD2_32_59]HAN08987.1 adenylate cyclase [Clostridiales bacterium]
MLEIEITYLAKSIPEGLGKCEHKEVFDIYLPKGEKHPSTRIRKNGNKYEITKKKRIDENDASIREEGTLKLTKDEFDTLKMIDGKKVIKERYNYMYNGKIAEIDIFNGELEGLVLVDIEFETPEEKNAFIIPDFCLADVSQEEFTAGGMLAGKSYSDIEEDLGRYNYKKIKMNLK